ncbi:SET and MYND domain-containing protein 4 [Chionoecetes opilio]|uniref:SET and MYND domain-containing protein 4 n=1 Tax=Chionoecetes opilio TaxID=41210 RepID=A0A8J4Z0Y0_CHIOP|nr:SET and MYND domain-containing protein 4 [Chionoecetes opilio]
MEGPSFQDLFSNLINRLKDEGKVMSVSEHFSAARDVEDMFSFLWGLEAAHQALTPRPTKAQKSEAKAEKLRSEGNRCYQKKLLARALDLYNQSIIYAQHPQIIIEKQPNVTGNEREEDLIYECQSKGCRVSDNEQSHRSLALSYANRSAVLFELGQYEKCIGDIDRALLHGYPRILYSKLAERKAKCLLSLQRKNEAKCLIESSLKSLDDLALDEEKTKLSKGTLQLLLQNCQEVDEVDDVPPEFSETHTDTKIKLLFSFESPEPPQLARHNPSIPSLSSSVNLAFSPNQGRHLVANQDIKPGEVIAVEDAYSKVVLLESSLHTHCTDCLARCLTPLPCPDCSQSSKFFVDAAGASFTPSVGDIVLTGSTLFTHMMNLPCNAHSITELKVNINSYQESISTEIGCGAFGVLSLTNHSCNPTAARFSFGATVALRALSGCVSMRLRGVCLVSSLRRLAASSLMLLCCVLLLLHLTSTRRPAPKPPRGGMHHLAPDPANLLTTKPLHEDIKRRMAERLARVSRVCGDMPAPSDVATAAMDEATRLRTQVLEDHQLMMCVVFKAGSTTWNSIVAHLYNDTEILRTKDFYKLIEVLNPTKKRFLEVSRSPLYLRALMARHPLARLLSAYRDRIEDRTHVTRQARDYGPLILRHTRGLRYSKKDMYHINGTLRLVPTFREFASYLASQPPQEYDPHWRPVSLQCGLCHINYSALVLTETYNEDVGYVMRESGLDQRVNSMLLDKNNNMGKGDTHHLADYYATLEPPLLQKIIDIYWNDFRMFNYSTADVLG